MKIKTSVLLFAAVILVVCGPDCLQGQAQVREWGWIAGSDIGALPSYGTLGVPAPGNTPGGRRNSSSWRDSSGNFWVFGGLGIDVAGDFVDFNDLWEFNPAIQEWTWVGGSSSGTGPAVYGTQGIAAPRNVPGTRFGSTSWTDPSGNLWLFGGNAIDSAGVNETINDLWMINPSIHQWAWISGSNMGGQVGVYGTLGTPAPGNVPGYRFAAAGWTDSKGNLWLFGGSFNANGGPYYNDLWEYTPSTNLWTWVGGSSGSDQPGIYGTLGIADPANIPGGRTLASTWLDSSGNFWLFGGSGFDSQGHNGSLNDLWMFNPSTRQWTWIAGNDTAAEITVTTGTPGVYGTWGIPAAGNVPGGRSIASTWTDNNGNLWLFGGFGFDALGALGQLNDLWEFNPSTQQWAWMAGSSTTGCSNLCGRSGIYGTLGVFAPENAPGGRIGAMSFTDTSGNLWLFGGGGHASIGSSFLDDVWEFEASATTLPAAAPTVSPAPGTYYPPQTVTISDQTPGSTIYYTTDGTTPTTSSTLYTGPIALSSTQTLQAIATASGYATSALTSATYTITLPSTATPTFSPASGNYSSPQMVSISDVTAGASIYYTTDGTVPNTSSKLYMGPITVSATENIEAIATAPGFAPSFVAAASYKINSPPPSPVREWAWIGGSTAKEPPGIYGTLGVPAAGNTPGGRENPITWTDSSGNVWLFGGLGFDNAGDYVDFNDFWQFNPATQQWTWVGGSSAGTGPAVYGTQGIAEPGNIPGTRYGSASWIDQEGNFWLFGGNAVDSTGANSTINDLWEFKPSANQWIWRSGSNVGFQMGTYGTLGTPAPENVPGFRFGASGWTDSSGNLWLFGGSYNGGSYTTNTNPYYNDVWRFNPSTNQWTWMTGSNALNPPGTYGTLQVAASGNTPGGRDLASTWLDAGGNLWLFGGQGFDSQSNNGFLNDLWKFNASTLQWTWMGGSNTVPMSGSGGSAGVYGTWGIPAAGNFPGGRVNASAWIDPQGNLWLFGGWGFDAIGTLGLLNDLWEFNPAMQQWAWMGGSSTVGCNLCGQSGVYGTLGVFAPENIVGGRTGAASWTDSKGNLWLFGGVGHDASNGSGTLNDVWEYQASALTLPAAAPSISLAPGTYFSDQTVTISDQTPGAAIYYTIDGTTPTTNSTPYTGPITVSSSETLSAKAVASGYAASAVVSATYSIALPPAATPSFSPLQGTYTSVQSVTISDVTPGAAIYYTTDGTTPTTSSALYTGAISVTASETLEAIATASGYSPSVVAVSVYTLDLPAASTPTFSPIAGSYAAPQSVTISDTTPGATIFLTTNGAVPTTSSTQYTGPITISASTTLKAIALALGYSESAVATAAYSIPAPIAALTPTSLTFASQKTGTTSAPQTMTLTNTGTSPLAITSISTTGDFSQTNSCAGSVAAGSNCSISVSFTPNARGTRNGMLTVVDDSNGVPGSTQSFNVSGFGTAPAATIGPSTLTFPAVMVNSSSSAQTATLTNTGDAALSIGNIAVGSNFAQTNTCGSAVAANSSCTVSVTFLPTVGGTLTGTLTITDDANGPGSTQTVALSGTGQDFSISSAPGASTSAAVTAGQTATYTLSSAAQSGLSGTVSFSVAGAPSLTTCSVAPNPAAVGQTVTVSCATTRSIAAAPTHRLIPIRSAPNPNVYALWTLPNLLLLVGVMLQPTRQRRRLHTTVVPLVLVLLILISLGCGGGGSSGVSGGSSSPGTPSGTYSLTVTGTVGSGSSAISHTIKLSLTVS